MCGLMTSWPAGRRTGVRFECLTVIDEYTRECLAIRTARRIRSDDVIHTLTELFVLNAAPEHIRSDNGPEFTAKVVRGWLERVGVKTLFHRARKSVGERLQRELQRETRGRTAKPGDLLFVEGGRDTDRTMAKGVQHDPTAQLTWIPAAGA